MTTLKALNSVGIEHGGKAIGLRRLIEMGLAVPDGVAFDTVSIGLLIGGDQILKAELLAWLSTGSGVLAVRSSARNEDGDQQSFAGVYESLLDVPGSVDAVIDAIRYVASSGQSDRVRSYFGESVQAIPVIVQRLVKANTAGVLFSRAVDVSGADCVYIEWIPGMGDALVSGKVTPATVVLPWHSELDRVDRAGIRVTKAVAPSSSVASWIELVEILAREKSATGWDVEWAIDENSRLWALQMRPITSDVLVPQMRPYGGGLPASPGVANGRARFVDGTNHESLKEGDVLVASVTEVAYIPAMRRAAAIITEEGGLLSHAAIVARELGKPCIVGAKDALTLLTNLELVEVNGSTGTIRQGSLLLGGGIRPEIDWTYVYLYDRGFELKIDEISAYVETTFGGIYVYVDDDTTIDQQKRVDRGIRRIFHEPANVVISDRRIWNCEWRRFYQLRTVSFVESIFKTGIASWNIDTINSAITLLKCLVMVVKQKTPSTELESLFWKEMGAALHSLVWVVVEGHAVWQAYRDSSNWRARYGVDFFDFVHGSQSFKLAELDVELDTVHSCLDILGGLRNSSYLFFVENGVFDDGYFGSRENLVQKVCSESGKSYPNENDALNQLYRSERFQSLDQMLFKMACEITVQLN